MRETELDILLAGATCLRVTLSNGGTLTLNRDDLLNPDDFAKSVWIQTGCRVRGDHEAIVHALFALAEAMVPA